MKRKRRENGKRTSSRADNDTSYILQNAEIKKRSQTRNIESENIAEVYVRNHFGPISSIFAEI